ncbi:hypothetical protein ICM05_07195 [Leucobacter sp. cx-42]|uniref:hypothetical protein n=1 Tax=unclassified Leucobacter TaxID=2621730 RepID=UPI00165DEFB7|nr:MULTISPECIES: hypothetical protein [unclassified Leucobacter]MBC9954433.1 hypothetical protein [Leucobacter sp. cx-42]
MSISERFFSLGGIVMGLGGTLGVAYYIYSLEAKVSFFSWPGMVALTVTASGLGLLLVGLFKRDPQSNSLRQHGGHGSKNYQAGRDMVIGGPHIDE